MLQGKFGAYQRSSTKASLCCTRRSSHRRTFNESDLLKGRAGSFYSG